MFYKSNYARLGTYVIHRSTGSTNILFNTILLQIHRDIRKQMVLSVIFLL